MIHSMVAITGRWIVVLTVTDPVHSAGLGWYRELLGMETSNSYVEDGHVVQVCLLEPRSGLKMCLVHHRPNPGGPFSEFRTRLDHLELLVADRDNLNAWAERLYVLRIPHSGVKEPHHGSNAMITFRDPDDIQLEFFWSAPKH